jgi:hypothetical protein
MMIPDKISKGIASSLDGKMVLKSSLISSRLKERNITEDNTAELIREFARLLKPIRKTITPENKTANGPAQYFIEV